MPERTGWPFLIGRGRTVGYRLLVVPSYLYESDSAHVLLDAAGGPMTESDTAVYREVLGSPAGDLTLVFQVVPLHGPDVELDQQGVLMDEHGRVIPFVEGVLLRGRVHDVQVSGDDLERVRQATVATLRHFWHSQDSWFKPTPADALVIGSRRGSESALRLRKAEPYEVTPAPPASLAPTATGSRDTPSHSRGHYLHKYRWTRRILLTIGLIMLAVLATVLVLVTTRSPSTPPPHTPTTSVNRTSN